MKWEYVMFNAVVCFSPILGRFFFPGMRFPSFVRYMTAVGPVAVGFILTDIWATNRFWYFNPHYILGPKLFGVPWEEVLFFFTVPWACLVLWENLRDRLSGSWDIQAARVFVLASVLLGIIGTILVRWWYTVAVLVASWIALLFFPWKKFSPSALVMGMVVVGLTLVCNGYLTARPIVLYYPWVMSNIRIGTIPIEDFVYGIILVSICIARYERNLRH